MLVEVVVTDPFVTHVPQSSPAMTQLSTETGGIGRVVKTVVTSPVIVVTVQHMPAQPSCLIVKLDAKASSTTASMVEMVPKGLNCIYERNEYRLSYEIWITVEVTWNVRI